MLGELRTETIHAAALDALAIGIAICDAGGRVAFANAAARELMRQRIGIALNPRGRELAAVEPGDARTLARLIEDAASGGRGGVAKLSGLIASVTPLPPALEGDAGHVLVTMRTPAEGPALSHEIIAALFALSPTQASIAAALFQGRAPEEIARERGIKISTLRTHLGEIFARTGAENQRELVRLLGTLPPLRG